MKHVTVLASLLLLASSAWQATATEVDPSRPYEVDAARLIGAEFLAVHAGPGEAQPKVGQLARSANDVTLTGERQEIQVERPNPKQPDQMETVTQQWVQVDLGPRTGWVDLHYLKPHIAGEALLCFVYLYGLLGIVFLAGMIYAWRQGDVGWGDPRQRRNMIVMTGGLLLYAVVHGFFQFVAPGF